MWGRRGGGGAWLNLTVNRKDQNRMADFLTLDEADRDILIYPACTDTEQGGWRRVGGGGYGGWGVVVEGWRTT